MANNIFQSVRSQGSAGRLQPINVYDEMDWIANRSRAELRATLEQIIRQERDNLVMKLNRCGSLSRPQSDTAPLTVLTAGVLGSQCCAALRPTGGRVSPGAWNI